jgi:hypothetical protein
MKASEEISFMLIHDSISPSSSTTKSFSRNLRRLESFWTRSKTCEPALSIREISTTIARM